jgi:RNA chaperone Hfq
MDHGRTLWHVTNLAKEIGTMESKPAQNIQDTFLNTVRKDKSPITIYLVSGVKLTGKIRSFDKYSVLLENNSQEQLACNLDSGEWASRHAWRGKARSQAGDAGGSKFSASCRDGARGERDARPLAVDN